MHEPPEPSPTSSPAPSTTPAPTTTTETPREPPPPPIWSPRDLWDPAGDPGPLRAAAGAWRAQGTALSTLGNTLGEIGEPLTGMWQGQAADGQQQSSVNLLTEIHDAATQCNDMATALEELADKIEEFNDSIRELYIAIASIVAVSVVGSFFTFGASAVAGAAATTGLIARATALVRGLYVVLRVAMTAMRTRAFSFATLGARWASATRGVAVFPRFVTAGYGARLAGFWKGTALTFAAGMPFTFINKALSNGKPWEAEAWRAAADPNNWRVEDLTASLYGAAFFGGPAGVMAAGRGLAGSTVAGTATRQPWGYRFANGYGQGLMLGIPNEFIGRFMVYDTPMTPAELQQAGVNIFSQAGLGMGLQGLWVPRGAPAGAPAGGGQAFGNWLAGYGRSGVIFVPGTTIAFGNSVGTDTTIQPQRGSPLFFWTADGPAPSGVQLVSTGGPGAMQPPPPRFLQPDEVLDTPTQEPLRVVVRPGESMWEFAERVYGDGNLYPQIVKANRHLLPDPNNPNLIHPGQEFLIPPRNIPTLPAT